MKRKYVYIGFAYPHHINSHAGYHQIENYINYDYVIDCQKYFNLCKASKTIFGKIALYLMRAILLFSYRIKLVVLGLQHNNLVFHFIYGENILFNIKWLIRKGNKIVCTIHQPYDTISKNKRLCFRLNRVDAIILMGKTEIDLFESRFHKKTAFIPHGICTDFYSPLNNLQKENMILTVGNWLRDYKFANAVYQRILETDETVRIVIVSLNKNKVYITPNNRLTFLSGIPDDELKMLYCKSSVLFLPLTRYTANNSLLEAAATGCNIIISSDYADNSYIPDKFVKLLPLNEQTAADAIMESFGKRYNMELVDFVKRNYSWKNIAESTRILYEEI